MSITRLAAGRRFADAIPDGERFRLRFLDGFEVICAWGDTGPEAVGHAQGIISADTVLHPQFQYVRGKTVQKLTTDGDTLSIHFTDGHSLRSRFIGSAPVVQAVDATVKIGMG